MAAITNYKEYLRASAERGRLIAQGIYTPRVDKSGLMHRNEIKTHTITGSPERADIELQKFYGKMQNRNGFKIISVNTVSVPVGVSIFITYQITT